jgi:site-specific DNA recombinase
MARRNRTSAIIAKTSNLRVAIYVRRSTDEENQPFTLEAQEAKLRSYIASQPGWDLGPVSEVGGWSVG